MSDYRNVLPNGEEFKHGEPVAGITGDGDRVTGQYLCKSLNSDVLHYIESNGFPIMVSGLELVDKQPITKAEAERILNRVIEN